MRCVETSTGAAETCAAAVVAPSVKALRAGIFFGSSADRVLCLTAYAAPSWFRGPIDTFNGAGAGHLTQPITQPVCARECAFFVLRQTLATFSFLPVFALLRTTAAVFCVAAAASTSLIIYGLHFIADLHVLFSRIVGVRSSAEFQFLK